MAGTFLGSSFEEDLKIFLKYKKGLASSKELVNFSNIFRHQLQDSAEFSFTDPLSHHLELTVSGNGEPFHYALTRFMEESGIETSAIDWYKEINYLFPGSGTLAKAAFLPDRMDSLSIYYQSPLSPDTFLRIVKSRKNIPAPDTGKFFECMKIFDRKIIFIGLDLTKKSPPSISPFLLVPPSLEGLSQKIFSAVEKITETEYNNIGEWNSLLLHTHDIFVSFAVGEVLQKRIKFDYENIPLTDAFRIIKHNKAELGRFKSLVQLSSELNVRNLFYLGLKFKPELEFKYYIKRFYFAKEDKIELVARFLENSAVRFPNTQ